MTCRHCGWPIGAPRTARDAALRATLEHSYSTVNEQLGRHEGYVYRGGPVPWDPPTGDGATSVSGDGVTSPPFPIAPVEREIA